MRERRGARIEAMIPVGQVASQNAGRYVPVHPAQASQHHPVRIP
jgi:hypothetical protein